MVVVHTCVTDTMCFLYNKDAGYGWIQYSYGKRMAKFPSAYDFLRGPAIEVVFAPGPVTFLHTLFHPHIFGFYRKCKHSNDGHWGSPRRTHFGWQVIGGDRIGIPLTNWTTVWNGSNPFVGYVHFFLPKRSGCILRIIGWQKWVSFLRFWFCRPNVWAVQIISKLLIEEDQLDAKGSFDEQNVLWGFFRTGGTRLPYSIQTKADSEGTKFRLTIWNVHLVIASLGSQGTCEKNNDWFTWVSLIGLWIRRHTRRVDWQGRCSVWNRGTR